MHGEEPLKFGHREICALFRKFAILFKFSNLSVRSVSSYKEFEGTYRIAEIDKTFKKKMMKEILLVKNKQNLNIFFQTFGICATPIFAHFSRDSWCANFKGFTTG